MTVLELLRPHTSHNAQYRGAEYVDRVRLQRMDATDVGATVRGTDLYDVYLRVEDDVLTVSCTCPHFVDHGAICKHVWATAIAANDRDCLTRLPASMRIETDFDGYNFVDDLGQVETANRWDSRRGGWQAPSAVPRVAADLQPWQQRRAAPPEWQTRLANVATGPAEPPEATWLGSELIYVVQAPAGATVTEMPLNVEKRERKKSGEWSKPRPSRLTFDSIKQLPDADDRWALSLIHAASSFPRDAGGYGYGLTSQPLGPTYLRSSLIDLLLPRLCPTGRVRLRNVAGPYAGASAAGEDVVLQWEDGEPWRFELVVTATEIQSGEIPDAATSGPAYRVHGRLTRGGEREDLRGFPLMTDSIAIREGRAARFDPAGGFAWVTELRRRGSVVIPADSKRALVDTLARSPVERIDVPDDLRWEERTVAPQFRVTIDAPAPFGACQVHAEVEYEAVRAGIGGSGRLISADGHVVYRRDADKERDALALLKRLGVVGLDAHLHMDATVHDRRMPLLVQALVAEGWTVEAEGVRYRSVAAPRLRIRSGIDWFDLEAVADTADAAIDVADLLKALASGRRTVRLGDGTLGMLPEDWLARVAPALSIGEAVEGGVRFKPSQVALIDALLATQPRVDWDEGFARASAALQRFSGVHPENPAPTFAGSLRDYQRDALGWMHFLRDFGFGGCLADDMGLGKTVMVLAMLDARRVDAGRRHRPSLIVLPRSLLFNWINEAARFTPDLEVLDFAHANRHDLAEGIARADLVLTTYGTLRRDVAMLKDQAFDYVVLDEAQAIKNPNTATAKATRLLRGDHRLALTGTPVENHLGELQSLFDFLNPGLLGRGRILNAASTSASAATSARRATGATGATGLPTVAPSGANVGAEANDHVARLARGLRPFFLRRTKEQVAPELPPRSEETLYCELEGEQLKLYQQLRTHYQHTLLKTIDRQGLAKSRFQVLEALLRLRQAACHTGLLSRAATPAGGTLRVTKDASAKFDMLLPRVAELVAEGRKALVFSQFTSLLALLRARLDDDGVTYEYLDGQTTDRQAHVERFQTDAACPLFLISLKAGGVGLNLTAAEYVFLLDPWWNPAVEMQAIDRTHRIGQVKPVFAYRLVSRNTVEERILDLQSRKRELADAILEAGSGGLRGLERDDLEHLLA